MPNYPTKTTPESEFWARLVHPYYNPRRRPFSIPTARWDEAPCWCISINEQWASHILALLDMLDQWDTWEGTNEEIDAARVQVNEFIACFMESSMCCCNDNQTTPQVIIHQVTPEGVMQVSYDGGVTWQQDPQDPRVTGYALPPPVTAGVSATKCDAATNGIEHLHDLIAEVSAGFSIAQTLTGLAAVIASAIAAFFFGPEVIPGFYAVITAVAAAAFGVGKDAFDAAFTNTVWDAMTCILYCNIEDNGQFTQSGFDTVLAQIPEKITDSIASFQLHDIIRGLGLLGLNNICSYGNAADSDCASCGCESCFYGWLATPGQGFGTNVTGTDAYGDYMQWTAEHTALNDYRVFINAYGEDTPADVNTCCTYNHAYFLTWNTAETAIVSIGSLGGFDCGNSSQAALNVAEGEQAWGIKAVNPTAFKLRVYKQLVTL